MSRRLRNTTTCIGKNKDADQPCSNCTADQRLCFRYTDTCSTIPLLLKSEISSFSPASVIVQAGLCRTGSLILPSEGSYEFVLSVLPKITWKFQVNHTDLRKMKYI